MGDALRPIGAVRLGGGMDDRQFRRRFLGIFRKARTERPVDRQFPAQQGDAGKFVQPGIIRLDPGHLQQFGDHALMHIAILPHVERGEMEAEGFDRADQPAERAAGRQRAIALARQPLRHGDEVAAEIARRGAGLALQRRRARRGLADQMDIGGRQSRINARNGAAIGLVLPAGRCVAARLRQRQHRFGHMRQFGRDRQFRAQRMDRFHIIGQRRLAATAQRRPQLRRLHERVAVTVAADPVADPQEAVWPCAQHPFPPAIKRGQRRQEDVAEIGQDIVDLVLHEQLLAAQRARLPQQRDLAEDRLVQIFAVIRLGPPGILELHQVGDAILVIDHALAPHLGRVGGQHRHDQAVRQQFQHRILADAMRFELGHRRRDIGTRFRRHALPILGQIGEHREQHEAAGEVERVV